MRLLTIKETADRCGLSPRQIYKLIWAGLFGPAVVHVGRSVRVRDTELERWFEAGCPGRDEFDAAVAVGRGADR